MKCVLGIQATRGRLPFSPQSGVVHCHEQMPEIKSLAAKAGLRVEEIDVDSG